MRKSGKPAWWKVDLVVPVTIGLLVLLNRLGLAAPWRQIGQVVVVGVSIGWMSVWTWLNAAAIEQERRDHAEAPPLEAVALAAGQAPPLTPRQAHYRRVVGSSAGSQTTGASRGPKGLGDL